MAFQKNINSRYDMATILQTDKKIPLDLPDYTNKSVRVQKMEGRGRGVIATEDILPGELIMVCRALAIVYADEEPITLRTEVQKMGRLREQVINSIRKSPDLTSNIYTLHAGPQLGYLENGHLKVGVDAERIERICALNGFECGSARSYGLWYFPSFLNHVCYASNAHWRIFGEMMFVRAARGILKGEEILISYIDPNRPYSERRSLFSKHDFFCHCKLCELELKEGKDVRRVRDIALDDFHNPNAEGVEPEDVVETLESLRPEHPHLNVFLISPLLELGIRHYEKKEFVESAQTFEKCFDLCKVSAQFNLVGVSCALTICICYLREKNPGLVQKWIGIGRNVVETQCGACSFAGIVGVIRPSFARDMQSAGYDLE